MPPVMPGGGAWAPRKRTPGSGGRSSSAATGPRLPQPASPRTDSGEAQELARRHVEWLTGIPGTPAAGGTGERDIKGYVTGLGDMYVADPRFAANYGGEAGAAFVRDALRIYAQMHL
jgi:hypothetical protein